MQVVNTLTNTQFTWSIVQLQYSGANQTVISVDCNIRASRDGQSTELIINTPLGQPDPLSFTPWDQLSSNQVLSWVLDAMDPAEQQYYMKRVEGILDSLTVVTTGRLPWSSISATELDLGLQTRLAASLERVEPEQQPQVLDPEVVEIVDRFSQWLDDPNSVEDHSVLMEAFLLLDEFPELVGAMRSVMDQYRQAQVRALGL